MLERKKPWSISIIKRGHNKTSDEGMENTILFSVRANVRYVKRLIYLLNKYELIASVELHLVGVQSILKTNCRAFDLEHPSTYII